MGNRAKIDPNHHKSLVVIDEVTGEPFALEGDADSGALKVTGLEGGSAGTQYTEGDTDASITGTAVMWEDDSDTLRAASSSNPFPVEIVAGAGSGGTASADDADFTSGSTSGTPAMGVYESSPSSVTDGDMGIVGITADRELKVSLASVPTTTVQATDLDIRDLTSASDSVEAVIPQPSSSTLSNVTMTGSAVTLASSNADRKGLYIFNDSGVTIQVKLGTGASATSFTVEMEANAYYELPYPVYTGAVTAIGASGDVRVTEVE